MAEPRVIKKYPNRRLYDTELSRYITLADLKELILQGGDFRVVDANNGEDLTRNILLQIITEQESGGNPLFTTDALMKMIRFYGGTVQDVFTRYMSESLELFVKQQQSVQSQFADAVSTNPMNAMTEITRRNLEAWSAVQESLLEAAGMKGPGDKKK